MAKSVVKWCLIVMAAAIYLDLCYTAGTEMGDQLRSMLH